jgi:malate dehydrogenase
MKASSTKKNHKISLIGSGNIGGACAYLIATKNIADVVLFDIVEGLPQGKALDLSSAALIEGGDVSIKGTNDYSDIANSDVIIVTAGLTRSASAIGKPFDRSELLLQNAKVITEVAENIKKYSPNALVVVVTNPLDSMTWLMKKVSGLNRQMVVGMAGGLDSSRFCYFLGKELGISPQSVSSTIIGEHGNTMVPLIRFSKVNDTPLDQILGKQPNGEELINNVIQNTKKAGAEIIKLMKTSAYCAPATAAMDIALAYLNNTKKTILCSTFLEGEYGVQDLCVGVPAIIGSKGVEQIVQLELQDNEKQEFQLSVESIQKLVTTLKNAMSTIQP